LKTVSVKDASFGSVPVAGIKKMYSNIFLKEAKQPRYSYPSRRTGCAGKSANKKMFRLMPKAKFAYCYTI